MKKLFQVLAITLFGLQPALSLFTAEVKKSAPVTHRELETIRTLLRLVN